MAESSLENARGICLFQNKKVYMYNIKKYIYIYIYGYTGIPVPGVFWSLVITVIKNISFYCVFQQFADDSSGSNKTTLRASTPECFLAFWSRGVRGLRHGLGLLATHGWETSRKPKKTIKTMDPHRYLSKNLEKTKKNQKNHRCHKLWTWTPWPP